MDQVKKELLEIVELGGEIGDHNPKYDITDEELELKNKILAGVESIVSIENIKTRKRTNKEYDAVWESFLKVEPEFAKYMGYGEDQIKSVGIKKFIDFMDWSLPSDVSRYKTDAVKVIVCQNCKKQFTTFQLDFGLCDKCKDDFDMDSFSKACELEERFNSGTSAGLIMMFTYLSDFRELYRKNKTFKEQIKLCVENEDLCGIISKRLILSLIGDVKKENYFIEKSKKYAKNELQNRRIESIEAILKSDDNEMKAKRIESIFKR